MSTIVDQAKSENISELQINAIMGSLMGDATFHPSGMTTMAVRWNHSSKQAEYVNHKYQILSGLETQPPFNKPNPGYGEEWTILTLRTTTVYHSLYTLLHPENVRQKTLTPEYLDEITHPIALAWWFMDDGSRKTGLNSGRIATDCFSLEEHVLLQDWLWERWGVFPHIISVTHPNGKEAYNLTLPRDAYLSLIGLIQDHVPECMKYKVQPIMTTCLLCGKQFLAEGQEGYCSDECRTKGMKMKKDAWNQEHAEEIAQRQAQYRLENKDLINARVREWRANLPPEKKAERSAYALKWRQEHPEQYRETKKRYLERHKDDPEFKAAIKEQNARYYQKVKQDPEKHEARLQRGRDYRHTEKGREAGKLYLRKHRAEKRAQDPEVLAKYQERMAHLEELSKMTPEQRKEYQNKKSMENYYKRKANRTPEEAAERSAKIREQQRKRMAKIKADPVRYAQFLADEKRRRAARKAKKLQKQEEEYLIPMDFCYGIE